MRYEENLMKIKSVRIENFRSFKDETINFNDYNCLVGPNGAGKSTVLNALNVFFREASSTSVDIINLGQEDFHAKDTTQLIRITVTFSDLDDKAVQDLKDYVRQDVLIVTAVAKWDESLGCAPVKQYGARLGIKAFACYFEALGNKAGKEDLASHYVSIQTQFPDIKSVKTKDGMTEALRAYEAAHPEKHELLSSEDQFYGVSRGENRLAKHVQWVFVPAVKDAVSEQADTKDTALARLLARTVRAKVKFDDEIKKLRDETAAKYHDLLDKQQSHLDGVSEALRLKLAQWSHQGTHIRLRWEQESEKSIRVDEPLAKIVAGEGSFEGELARLGHGLQRSYLLALIHELAGIDDSEAPRLLLAIEEPELFQHPPQAQHLAEVLEKLSGGKTQIFACTHSPYFVVGKGVEDIRLVRKQLPDGSAHVTQTTFDEVAEKISKATGEKKYLNPGGIRAKIHQSLQPALKEMFFCRVLVLVEGLEDVAYITAGLHLLGLWEKWREIGGHLVSVGGKSEIMQPLSIAQLMKIPTFTIYDADGATTTPKRERHEADNRRLLVLLGKPGADLFPTDIQWNDTYVVWPEDIGSSIKSDYDRTEWQKWTNEVEHAHGCIGSLAKNSLFIGDIMAKAWEAGKPSLTLTKLCNAIIAFAEKV